MKTSFPIASGFTLLACLFAPLAVTAGEAILQPGDPPGTFTPAIGGCNEPPYLLTMSAPDAQNFRTAAYNRIEWWGKIPPPTGSINKPFECEFTPGLARVVGSAMRPVEQAGHRAFRWDQPALTTLKELQNTQFSVRVNRPFSEPRFASRALGGGVNVHYLVNDVSPGTTLSLAPNQFRPSLWIDFERPQRAVGLEYGFEPVPEQPATIRGAGVILIGYDANGVEVASSRGDKSGLGANVISASSSDAKIGVRDREARIMSVELRFERDGDPAVYPDAAIIRAPQRLFRVWHEQLPVAAIKQGRVATKPIGLSGGEPIETGFVTHALPFKHDRATVFMRGFRLSYDDGQPHPVGMVHAGLRNDKNASVTGTIFKTTPGGLITFRAAGGFFYTGKTMASPASTAIIHYSILSWNSKETELFDRPIVWDFDLGNNTLGDSTVLASDPMPGRAIGTSSTPSIWRQQTETLRGGIMLLAQDLQWTGEDDDDIDLLSWRAGSYLWDGLDWTGRNTGLFASFSLRAFMRTEFEGTGHRDFFGSATALTGRSLLSLPQSHPNTPATGEWQVQPINPNFANIQNSERASLAFYKQDWVGMRRNRLSFPIFADAAGVGLGYFQCEPDGELRHLDFEVHGANYMDGILDWEIGGTLSTTADGSKEMYRHAAFADFFAVRSIAEFATPKLSDVPMYFEVFDGGINQRNTLNGAGEITNTGTADVLITEINPGVGGYVLPEDLRISYSFVWRGGPELSLDEIRRRLPLQLRPGEKLVVRGRYQGVPNSALAKSFQEIAMLSFLTGDPLVDRVLRSTVKVTHGTPAGRWSANTLRFQRGGPGQQASLLSTGDVMLAAYDVVSLNPAFTVERLATGGNLGPFLVRYVGSAPGFNLGTLRADTNAGLMDIRVEGVNLP